MILVTFALEYEGRAFEKTLSGKGDANVQVLYTGVGLERAETAVSDFLKTNAHPKLIVASGFGGGISPEVERGHIIVDGPEDLPGQVIEKLKDRALMKGVICSVTEVLETSEDRSALWQKTGALAVDMESAAIRRSAEPWKIPVLVLRFITDAVNDPLPVPANILFDSTSERVRVLALLGYLASHPAKIAPFIRFARHCSRGSHILGKVIARLLTD